jgi:hypothetical protein
MLLHELARTDLRTARHSVLYDLEKPKDVATMNKKDRDLMAFIASTYDRIGHFVKQGLLPSKPLFAFHGEDIGLLWRKIWPVVKYYREEEQPRRPNYCNGFKWLGTVWLPRMQKR